MTLHKRRSVWLVCALLLVSCGKRDAAPEDRSGPIQRAEPATPRNPTGADIEYTVSFTNAANHYVDIAAIFPTGGADKLELMMAVWTPGSYKVREFARHIEDLSASTLAGDPLVLSKVRKNRWTVGTGGNQRVSIRYRVYAREWTVRTNFIDAEMAILNGAPTFMTLAGEGVHRHDLVFEPAPSWKEIVTALPAHPDGAAHHYLAPDYDTLVDSPLVLGNPALETLELEGVDHVFASFGGHDAWDNQQAAKDVRTLVAGQLEFWGIVPYERYVFLNVLGASHGGGLEHKASTLMMANRWFTRKRADYLKWLGLVSHEFFHTWNAKRLRPVELGPFDYENERHTRSLWVVEGLTSYYDDLLLRRAGLMSHSEYLEKLSGNIDDLQKTPGRKHQPLSRASYDAWIKYYRYDENSINSSISYYTKGAVVGFLLDIELRKRSFGRKSLDQVMRAAYERYAGDLGYSPEQFRAVAEEIAGGSLAEFWTRYIDGTDELDYKPALAYLGLRFKKSRAERDQQAGTKSPKKTAGKKAKDDEPAGWLGGSFSDLKVKTVPKDTPAFRAGLNRRDELIAIDGHRLGSLDKRLARYRPGDKITLLIARRGVVQELVATLERKPEPKKLEVASDDLATTARRRAWMGPDSAGGTDDTDDGD